MICLAFRLSVKADLGDKDLKFILMKPSCAVFLSMDKDAVRGRSSAKYV